MKEKYFTNKQIVSMAVIAAAMFVVSCITVPLVLGVPFPGIRCLACGLFFGLLIALAYVKVPKVGTGTVVTLICSLPMFFFSWVITAFTVAAGICTDIYFLLVRKRLTTATITGLGIVIMSTMMVIAESFGIWFIENNAWTSFSQYMAEGWRVAIGFLGSAILGGLGSFLATKVFKEFKSLKNQAHE